jgi:hypothetical protein
MRETAAEQGFEVGRNGPVGTEQQRLTRDSECMGEKEFGVEARSGRNGGEELGGAG